MITFLLEILTFILFMIFVFKLGTIYKYIYTFYGTVENLTWYEIYEIIARLIIYKLRTVNSNLLSTGKVIKYTKNYTDIVYFDGMDKYIIRYPKVRGKFPFIRIDSVIIHDNEIIMKTDITDNIKTFAGPHGNFHGIPVTPAYLGYGCLIVTYKKDGEVFTKIFEKDDRIVLDI